MMYAARPIQGKLVWERRGRTKQWWLIGDNVNRWDYNYDPTERHPGLFLDFIQIDIHAPDEGRAEILRFSQQYGMLQPPERLAGAFTRRDRMSEWHDEIRIMQTAVDLWLLIKYGDTSSLRESKDRH